MPEFRRTYSIPTGELEIIITYDATYTPLRLDMDVLEDIELEYGYEDEDQLTFYPNILRLKFDDFKKQNFDVLKLSVGAYNNTLPENHMNYGGVEIRLNGHTKFKGYIDELSLKYDEKDLTVEFDVLDKMHILRNTTVNRDWIIHPYTNERLPNSGAYTLPLWLFGIFRKVYPEYQYGAYPAEMVNVPGLYSLFVRHDWLYHGDDLININNQQVRRQRTVRWDHAGMFDVGFIFDSTPLWGQDRPYRTWAEWLRGMAINFGAIIGVADYGKVYFMKRFAPHNPTLIDISDNVIDFNFNKQMHLPVLRGAVATNRNQGIENRYEFGEIERSQPSGDYQYPERVKEIRTYLPQYRTSNQSFTGILVRYEEGGHTYGLACWSQRDEQINQSGLAAQLVGKWQRDTRIAPKDKVEVELDGIDYDMVSIYQITPPNTSNLAVNFRAMTMKKSLLKNKTNIVGIEI